MDYFNRWKRTLQNEQGEILNLFIRKEWMGKEIKVMPYLKSATEKVCQQTLVMKKLLFFYRRCWRQKIVFGIWSNPYYGKRSIFI